MQYGRIQPEGLPSVIAVLREACQGQKTGGGTVDRPAVGLAQIVDSRPEELTADIVVFRNRFPFLQTVTVFAAEEWQGREAAVVLFVQMLFIVVADNVQRVKIMQSGRKLRKCGSQRDRTCGIIAPYNFSKMRSNGREPFHVRLVRIVLAFRSRFVGVIVSCHFREQGMAVGIVGIVDFVSDAPEDDRRMIAVSEDHVGKIPFMPLGEILKVTLMPGRIYIVSGRPLVFRVFPFVERFAHHQKAQSVTQIIQLGHMRVVAGADGVAAHFLQRKQPSFPDLRGHGRAQAASVMMDAYALQLHAAAVQEEALVSVKAEGTDSDLSFIYLIGRLAVDGKLGDERIKSRELGGPELGILHAAV